MIVVFFSMTTIPGLYLRARMRFVAALILSIILAPLVMQVSVLSWYQINKGYITEVLCVNRNMPEMHCDGKCVLAQKLKQASREKANDLSAIPEIQLIIPVFLPQAQECTFNHLTFSSALDWTDHRDHYSLILTQGLFHPPPTV